MLRSFLGLWLKCFRCALRAGPLTFAVYMDVYEIDFGEDTALWGPLAVLQDGLEDALLPDTHPKKFEWHGGRGNLFFATAEACSWERVPSRFLSGKVALITLGGCGFMSSSGFAAKARYAQRAGAIAIILYGPNGAQGRPPYYTPDHWSWVDEIIIPIKIIHTVDGHALRGWLANGLNLIAFSIDSHTLGIRVAGTCGTIDIDGTPCPAYQVKHVNGLATCNTECHNLDGRTYLFGRPFWGNSFVPYESTKNTTASGHSCVPVHGHAGRCLVEYSADFHPWCWISNDRWEFCDIPACSLTGTLHTNVGSCDGVSVSMGNHPEGREWTWSECAIQCLSQHPDDAKAIDGPKDGECYCFTSCPHLTDCGEDDLMALKGFELPTMCV